MHLPPKAQDISAGQRSDRRVHPLLRPRAPPDKDWPGSALASPGQAWLRLFYPLQASLVYCPHNMGRVRRAERLFTARLLPTGQFFLSIYGAFWEKCFYGKSASTTSYTSDGLSLSLWSRNFSMSKRFFLS